MVVLGSEPEPDTHQRFPKRRSPEGSSRPTKTRGTLWTPWGERRLRSPPTLSREDFLRAPLRCGPVPRAFDRDYYDRFYRDPSTRVADVSHYERLGRFVGSYAALLDVEIRSILDLGCGLGQWRSVAETHFDGAAFEGVEVSAYLCEELGWTQGSADTFRGEPRDLVVCQGVLQYLNARAATRAIRNIARHATELAYVEVLTAEDWERHCDQSKTDGDVYLRPAAWYRTRLHACFEPLGGGLFLPHDSDVVLYELERPCPSGTTPTSKAHASQAPG